MREESSLPRECSFMYKLLKTLCENSRRWYGMQNSEHNTDAACCQKNMKTVEWWKTERIVTGCISHVLCKNNIQCTTKGVKNGYI